MNEHRIVSDQGSLSRQIDRLVDGELDAEARRQLIRSFDIHPDRWRACAWAFLEAQAWRESATSMASRLSDANGEIRSSAQATNGSALGSPESETEVSKSSRSPMAWAWALAASLLAFVLGTQVRFDPPIGQRPPVVGQRMTASDIETAGEAEYAPLASSDLPTDEKLVTDEKVEEADDNQVTFVLEQGDREEMVQVPLLAGEALPEFWHQAGDDWIAPEVIEYWQQLGHEVRRQRRFAPIEFDDGRRYVVPVEDVEITPIRWVAN